MVSSIFPKLIARLGTFWLLFLLVSMVLTPPAAAQSDYTQTPQFRQQSTAY